MTSRDLFEAAVAVVLAHEGDAYTDHPLDLGGPTKYGIALRWHPDVNVRDLTRTEAIEIYWERYWKGQCYDRLPGRVAVKVFDLAITMGKGSAVRCLQRALRAVGRPVAVDGIMGSETWAAAAQDQTDALLASLRAEAAGHYRLIVARNPTQTVFLAGWENRAYA